MPPPNMNIPSTDALPLDEFAIAPACATTFGISIALAGSGGSGKTFTALCLARAFAQGGPYGLIDTEAGRGRRYHKYFTFEKDGQKVPYLYGQLDAPYAPERYIGALKAMQAAGVKAVVVDSASPEWEGSGGILEIHNEFTGGQANRNLVGWAHVKPRHRRFIEFAKNTGIHVIMCFRAREKSKPNPDRNAPPHEKIISLGWQPITNEAASFEFDLFAMLEPNGEGKIANDGNFKTFIDFKDAWKPGHQISPKICQRLVDIHGKMCQGAPEVDVKISKPDPQNEESQQPADEAIPQVTTNGRKAGGLQQTLMTLADATDMAQVIAIEDKLDAHRANMTPKKIEAINKAIREAKSRLNGEERPESAADRYAQMIEDGDKDDEEIRALIDGDKTLAEDDVTTLFSMLSSKIPVGLRENL